MLVKRKFLLTVCSFGWRRDSNKCSANLKFTEVTANSGNLMPTLHANCLQSWTYKYSNYFKILKKNSRTFFNISLRATKERSPRLYSQIGNYDLWDMPPEYMRIKEIKTRISSKLLLQVIAFLIKIIFFPGFLISCNLMVINDQKV